MLIPPIFFVISGFINFLTSFLLAILLFVKSGRIKANRYFGYFCLCVAFWSFFYCVKFAVSDPKMQMYYLILHMSATFYIPTTFIHFIKHFLKRNIPAWFIAFNYGFSIAATLIAFTPLYAYGMEQFLGFWWMRRGPFFDVTFLHFGLIVAYSLWSCYDTYKRTTDENFRRQVWILFVGCLIGYTGGAMNYNLWYRIPVPPVTNVCVAVYVVMVTYAILKYQFMDIRIIIRNSLVYSLMVSVITIVYFSMIYVSVHYLKGAIGYESSIASLATAFVIAIFFIPLKEFFQSLVEKYVFKATYVQIMEQNERLRREIMVSERYKTFAEITRSVTSAIRSPLTVLKTYSYYFQDRLDDRAFLEKFSQVFKAEVQKMEDMTNELTQYSSPEPLVLQKVDIHSLLNDVLKSLEHQLAAQKVGLHKEYNEAASFWFEVDPKQFQQTLVNLVRHALASMPGGGELWVGTQKAGGFFNISIKDTGRPVPQDQRDKIFDPFYRYNEENRGLELAIAFSIIESHGGKISLGPLRETGNELIVQLPVPE